MKAGIIYKITNVTNGNSYIGKTIQDVNIRWKAHIKVANNGHNWTLSRAIRKHGELAFSVEVIVDSVPIYFLDAFEMYWIDYYNTFKKGYNMTIGGEGTIGVVPWNKGKTNVYSEDTLQKMSKAKKGCTPTNLEQLRNLAKKRTGSKHQNSKLANIFEYKTDLLIAKEVVIADWCKKNSNYNQGNLSATARGTRKQCNGIYAKYINEGE